MIVAPFVGEDPGDACGGGCAGEFGGLVLGCGHCHGYDDGVLAFECGDEGGGVVVVDVDSFEARGELAGAFGAGEGCDGEFAGRYELFGDVGAGLAAGLDVVVREGLLVGAAMTYSNNGDVLDVVARHVGGD